MRYWKICILGWNSARTWMTYILYWAWVHPEDTEKGQKLLLLHNKSVALIYFMFKVKT